MVGPVSRTIEDYEAAVEAEVKAELDRTDIVYQEIQYTRFLSRSKGWRNGKRQLRKGKEVHLVGRKGIFRSWHLFPFDVIATEIIGQHADGEMLKERIIELWGY
ncbi:hypothetical protein LCGC14_0686660 [marine sediment metagenome]|uniref:Uncharacterized protein n=1 Tax=marine sediment metagenome TaxID=412755 RepID=A0A0F9QRI0_9ZZZZ